MTQNSQVYKYYAVNMIRYMARTNLAQNFCGPIKMIYRY